MQVVHALQAVLVLLCLTDHTFENNGGKYTTPSFSVALASSTSRFISRHSKGHIDLWAVANQGHIKH